MTAPQQETNGAPGRWVQHIYCSAIISKKMCDALTSYAEFDDFLEVFLGLVVALKRRFPKNCS